MIWAYKGRLGRRDEKQDAAPSSLGSSGVIFRISCEAAAERTTTDRSIADATDAKRTVCRLGVRKTQSQVA